MMMTRDMKTILEMTMMVVGVLTTSVSSHRLILLATAYARLLATI